MGRREGEGCVCVLIITHGRSRMAIDPPSHPYNAGTEHIGFSPTRQTLLACGTKREAPFWWC